MTRSKDFPRGEEELGEQQEGIKGLIFLCKTPIEELVL